MPLDGPGLLRFHGRWIARRGLRIRNRVEDPEPQGRGCADSEHHPPRRRVDRPTHSPCPGAGGDENEYDRGGGPLRAAVDDSSQTKDDEGRARKSRTGVTADTPRRPTQRSPTRSLYLLGFLLFAPPRRKLSDLCGKSGLLRCGGDARGLSGFGSLFGRTSQFRLITGENFGNGCIVDIAGVAVADLVEKGLRLLVVDQCLQLLVGDDTSLAKLDDVADPSRPQLWTGIEPRIAISDEESPRQIGLTVRRANPQLGGDRHVGHAMRNTRTPTDAAE